MSENTTTPMKFEYDPGADSLFVSLGTDEPSFRKEIDEYVMVDFGRQTGAPIGFHVLHIKDTEVESVQVLLQKTMAKLTIRKKQSLVYWFNADVTCQAAQEAPDPVDSGRAPA
jgi:uncharacterized protein YuzE